MSSSIQYLGSRELSAETVQAFTPIVVAMPFTQAALAQQSAQLLLARAGIEGLTVLCVHDDEGIGFVRMANLIFAKTQSDYFAYVAQDAYAGRHWLSLGIQALGQTRHLLGFNDGKWQGQLAAFGLVKRPWAQANYGGALFYEGYVQHYEDVELTLLAMEQDVYAYDPHSILFEVDWQKDQKPVNPTDRELFQRRCKGGFDGRVMRPELLKMFA